MRVKIKPLKIFEYINISNGTTAFVTTNFVDTALVTSFFPAHTGDKSKIDDANKDRTQIVMR